MYLCVSLCSVHSRLSWSEQVQAGDSNTCTLLSNMPLCGRKLKPSVLSINKRNRLVFAVTHALRLATLSLKHTDISSVEASQPDSCIYYIIIGLVILFENFSFAYAITALIIGRLWGNVHSSYIYLLIWMLFNILFAVCCLLSTTFVFHLPVFCLVAVLSRPVWIRGLDV